MKPINIYLIFLLIIIKISLAERIYIAYNNNDDETEYIESLIKRFNEISIKNNWDIHIVLSEYFNSDKLSNEEYHSRLSDLLNNETSNQLDLIIFENTYLTNYSDYLQNLKLFVPVESLNKYLTEIGKKISTYNNHPLYLNYGILYSNKEYLNKYGRAVPETWDELIETVQQITKSEKKKDEKSNITGYAGLMPMDDEDSICSLYEFLYSFRDDINDDIPNFRSQNAKASLEKIYEIKRKISTDEVFKLNSNELFNYMDQEKNNNNEKKILFIKNWYKKGYEDKYFISKLPGNKKGITASSIGGRSIGINKYLNNREIKNIAGKIIDFIISDENQMHSLLTHSKISGLDTIYYNKTFCSMEAVKDICGIYLNSQPVVRPYNISKSYKKYSSNIRNYLNEYIYNNKTTISAGRTLEKIDNILKVHYIEFKSLIGCFSFIASITTLTIILIFYILIFNYKWGKKFIFFSKTYWFIYLIGIGLIICYLIFNIGEMTLFKCHVKVLTLSIGLTLTSTLQCIKLISNAPSKSNLVLTFQKNFALILSSALWIDISLCSLLIFTQYENKIYYKNDDINFRRCEFPTIFSKLVLIILILYKILTILTQFIFIYMEWKDIFLKIDIKLLFCSNILSFIFGIIFIVICLIYNTDLNQYYLLKNIIVFNYCIVNLCFNFLSRFFVPLSYYEKNNINVKKYAKTFNEINDIDNDEIND
ncbi:hypothetical protein U3516DRAFT_829703 [Neocallimastix sp. 'constans']